MECEDWPSLLMPGMALLSTAVAVLSILTIKLVHIILRL